MIGSATTWANDTMHEAINYLSTILAWLWAGELLVLGLVCLVYACSRDKQPTPKQTERPPAPVIQLENHRHGKRTTLR